MGRGKHVLRGKFIVIRSYLRNKTKQKISNKQASFPPKATRES